MKILYISQYFPPEIGAPSARVHELSREWAALGHEVTVLTGFPNYPTGVVPESHRGRLFMREGVDGIQVVRVPIYATANRGFFRRVLNYFSYSVSTSVFGPLRVERPDVVIATSPPFLMGLAGLSVARTLRVPLVFEVRDLWPRSIVEVGAMKANTPAIRVLERLERFLYRHADHIVPLTESFVEEIAAHGVDRSKMSVVTNGVDLELFRPGSKEAARRELGLPDGFIATYVGTHGLAHGLGTVLDAARCASAEGVTFLLVGEGAEKAALKERARAEGIKNVMFWDQQPRDRVSKIIDASDACLVLLRDKPLFKTVIPSKMFEFMGAARAIVTTVDGESRRILDRAGAGVYVRPEDGPALAGVLADLRSTPERLVEMGRSGRRFVEANYSRPALACRYVEVLQELVARGCPAPSAALR